MAIRMRSFVVALLLFGLVQMMGSLPFTSAARNLQGSSTSQEVEQGFHITETIVVDITNLPRQTFTITITIPPVGLPKFNLSKPKLPLPLVYIVPFAPAILADPFVLPILPHIFNFSDISIPFSGVSFHFPEFPRFEVPHLPNLTEFQFPGGGSADPFKFEIPGIWKLPGLPNFGRSPGVQFPTFPEFNFSGLPKFGPSFDDLPKFSSPFDFLKNITVFPSFNVSSIDHAFDNLLKFPNFDFNFTFPQFPKLELGFGSFEKTLSNIPGFPHFDGHNVWYPNLPGFPNFNVTLPRFPFFGPAGAPVLPKFEIDFPSLPGLPKFGLHLPDIFIEFPSYCSGSSAKEQSDDSNSTPSSAGSSLTPTSG